MDLPNELIRAICFDDDGLKGKDLKSLRLVNKHISDFASDSFAEIYLESFTVVMTRSSIQAFIDISRHSRFSRYVHTQYLACLRFSRGSCSVGTEPDPSSDGNRPEKGKV